jgi:predicted type IV restriction endonuclease
MTASDLTLDVAFEKTKQIAADAKQCLERIVTEEDAKIQIITRVLTECLGWLHSDIRAEQKHESGYSDYVLSEHGRALLVIEAKRLGSLKINTIEKGTLKHLKLSSPALNAVARGIDQAAAYAMPHGIPLALLTDGQAWVIFKTFVTGHYYKDKQAFVFPSLDAVIEHFSSFFDLLAKRQCRKNSTIQSLTRYTTIDFS